MTLEAAATLVGGIGLFLLGMTMMTDGLKLAAGPTLERILAAATRTRWHGLGSGMLVTAMVQSSTAVTVATIGFVNAGLLTLGPALWVLFGANVGTTMTSWIVALVGLKFKIETLALPLVGAGVLLRLTGGGTRRGPLGDAVAGFGLLFLGIALLQSSFAGGSGAAWLPRGEGPLAVLMQVGAGVLMTLLTQSSSAAMALTLTAAQGGLLSAQAAAAVVIGANVGTTATALMVTIGATPNARRAALAHVAFNVLTAAVAMLLLPWLIGALAAAREALALPPDPAAKLALFHTVFNVLGVLLMWPLAAPLTRWLQRRYRAAEEDRARPRHLDDTVLAVPMLALDALEREIDRLGGVAREALAQALAGADAAAVGRTRDVVERLDAAVERFTERLTRGAMQAGSAQRIARWLRVLRYHQTAAEMAQQAAGLGPPPAAATDPETDFVAQALAVVAACGQAEAATLETAQAALEDRYQALKAALLEAGARGQLGMAAMDQALGRASALRRGVAQAVKAARLSAAPREAGAGLTSLKAAAP